MTKPSILSIRGATITAFSLALLASCGQSPASEDLQTDPQVRPEPVNGWVELPLADNTIKTQPRKWRTDVVEIPVAPNGGEIEYKLAVQEGDSFVYSVSYENLVYADEVAVEFHGHTEKGPDGVGDLMFYSVTDGNAENGTFTAPFSGDHGWYLKNDSDEEVVARLELAGFYDVVGRLEIGSSEVE